MAVMADANDLGLITTSRPAQVSWALWVRRWGPFLLFSSLSMSSFAFVFGYDINKRRESCVKGIIMENLSDCCSSLWIWKCKHWYNRWKIIGILLRNRLFYVHFYCWNYQNMSRIVFFMYIFKIHVIIAFVITLSTHFLYSYYIYFYNELYLFSVLFLFALLWVARC